MATPTITRVSPLKATRGATGTTITITGTNFGASGGSVKIGGVTAIAATWSASSITCLADDSPVTPLGVQDVEVLTSADGNVTKEQAIMVVDPTEQFATTDIVVNTVSAVYVDGLQVGYTEDTIDIKQSIQTEDVMSNNRLSPIKTLVTGQSTDLSFSMIQINGANLAMSIGGTWDSVSKILKLTGIPTIASHSVLIVESDGSEYLIPNCQLITPASITIGGKSHRKLPVTLRALPVADDTSDVVVMYLP